MYTDTNNKLFEACQVNSGKRHLKGSQLAGSPLAPVTPDTMLQQCSCCFDCQLVMPNESPLLLLADVNSIIAIQHSFYRSEISGYFYRTEISGSCNYYLNQNQIAIDGRQNVCSLENLNRRYLYFITFLKLPPKCTSLQVKVVLKNCTLLQVESKTIYSSKVTK